MVKIRTVSRSKEEFTRSRPTDPIKLYRNVDPLLHPFEKEKEYVRALNATKLDKVFAKPFVGALNGHQDGVYSMSKHPKSLVYYFSGGCDGELRVWNVPKRTTVAKQSAHRGFVRGIAVSSGGDCVVTASDDRVVKLWSFSPDKEEDEILSLLNTYTGEESFTAIDHQRGKSVFATTSGSQVDIWDHDRSDPLHTYEWGVDSLMTIKFNPIETHLLAATAADRSVTLYDLRAKTPIKKFILSMKSNAVSWNPMEAFHFALANEDHNCYTYDMRKLEVAHLVHQDHVSAVLDLDFSPTGREFVTGSFDKTIRIFKSDEVRSREVYHTKRMQRIFTVKFSYDARFVFSGSDDTNIRIWKANAAQSLKVMNPREKEKLDYCNKLKEKYQYFPEIRRIARHRHLPRNILKATRKLRFRAGVARRKEENIKRHSSKKKNPELFEKVSFRKKAIVEVLS